MTALAFTRKPDADLVAWLEERTQQAREGKITGYVGVFVTDEGAMNYSVCSVKNRAALTGYLFHVLHRLQYDAE